MSITAGIDVGSTYTKCVLLQSGTEVVGKAMQKTGVRLAEMCTGSPVFGFRPSRASRTLTWTLPKPRISMRSPSFSASIIESKIVLTTTSVSFLEMCGVRLATSSISPPICSRPVRWAAS